MLMTKTGIATINDTIIVVGIRVYLSIVLGKSLLVFLLRIVVLRLLGVVQ